MKKYFSVLIIIFLLILLSSIILFNYNKSRNIEEILGVDFNDIAYIKAGSASEQTENVDVNTFIKEYKNNKYKKTFGSYESTTHMYFVCYDSNNNVIFTLVDIGNKNLVFLKKGKFDINKDNNRLYQLK